MWWGHAWQGLCIAGGMHGQEGAWQGGVHGIHTPLPVDRMTDACKNITLQTSFVGDKNRYNSLRIELQN